MRHAYALLLLFMMTIALVAQSNAEKALFNSGLESYKNGDYSSAQATFLRILQEHPQGNQITATRLMLAKSYYKLNDYSKTEVVCKYFFTKHPESVYVDDLHHVLGNTYFKMGQYTKAIDEWVWVLNNSKDPRLRRTDAEYVYKTMDAFLNQQQIDALAARYPDDVFQGLVQLVTAKQLIVDGQRQDADQILNRFLAEDPNHIYADEARNLLGSSVVASGNSRNFLFLKPIDEDTKLVANDLENGMQYALREYQRRNPGEDIELTTVEIEPTAISALSTAKNAIVQNNPLGVISPIDPDQAASIAVLSGYETQPCVVPLSSQTGLAQLNSYTFQINPDARTKGKFLGSYVANELGLKKMAVLAPVNEYGQDFVQSFVEELQIGGSEIRSMQWYYESAQDFTRQFRAIWREGMFLAFEDSVLTEDSTMTEAAIKLAYRGYLDEIFEPRVLGSNIDSTDVPATGIDGLLIVIRSPEFIQFVAPQLAFNNIQTMLIGNEGWNDQELLKKYRHHLEGMVYITAGHFDSNASNYRVFMNRYRNEMRQTPDKFHLLGYDIMNWILSNYSPGLSKEGLRQNLEQTSPYRGILQSIQFSDTPRVNSSLTLLKLNRGQIIQMR